MGCEVSVKCEECSKRRWDGGGHIHIPELSVRTYVRLAHSVGEILSVHINLQVMGVHPVPVQGTEL